MKHCVFYITRKKIWALSLADRLGKLIEADWDGVNPEAAFKKIKSKLKVSSARLILGDEISYCLALLIPPGEATREKIRGMASNFIPEDVTDYNFDWKLVGREKKENQVLVQVIATPGKLLSNISLAARSLKIKIIDILPVSIVLSSQVKSEKGPTLILWQGQERLGVVAQKGIVFFSESLTDLTEINNLLAFTKDRYGLKIERVVADWEGIEDAVSVPQGIALLAGKLNPLLSLAKSTVTKGEDKKVLSISAQKPQVAAAKAREGQLTRGDNLKEADHRLLILVSLLFAAIAGISAAVFLLGTRQPITSNLRQDTSKKVVDTILSPTPSQSLPSESPTPKPSVNFAQVRVNILNGNGIPGSALDIAGILREAGFEDISTGNADSYSYKGITVSLKKEIARHVYEEIEVLFNNDYQVTLSSQLLSPGNEFDAVIVVGQRGI